MEQKPTALIPSSEVLEHFKSIDPTLPRIIIETSIRENNHDFVYAMTAQISGTLLMTLFVGGFIYLVMHDHQGSATGLLGGGMLTAVGWYLRIRYRDMLSDPDSGSRKKKRSPKGPPQVE